MNKNINRKEKTSSHQLYKNLIFFQKKQKKKLTKNIILFEIYKKNKIIKKIFLKLFINRKKFDYSEDSLESVYKKLLNSKKVYKLKSNKFINLKGFNENKVKLIKKLNLYYSGFHIDWSLTNNFFFNNINSRKNININSYNFKSTSLVDRSNTKKNTDFFNRLVFVKDNKINEMK